MKKKKMTSREDVEKIIAWKNTSFGRVIIFVHCRIFGHTIDMSKRFFDRVDFTGMDLSYISFRQSNFRNCTIGSCNISHADFSGSRFIECDISTCGKAFNTIWNDAVFNRCTMTAMSFRGNKNMKRISFKKGSVVNTSFDAIFAPQMKWSAVTIKNIECRNAHLSNLIMDDAVKGSLIVFDGSDMRGSRVSTMCGLSKISITEIICYENFLRLISKDTPRFGLKIINEQTDKQHKESKTVLVAS